VRMKFTPRLAHFVSLSTPSPGATPAARRSRFRGVPGLACRGFMRCGARASVLED